MRGELVVPTDLAGVDVERDDAVGVEVVARAYLTVEVGGRVAGARVVQVRVGIERPGDPVVRAAALPGLAVGRPGLGARLTRLGHGVGAPQMLAGLQVPTVDVATHAEPAAGAAGG